MTQENIPVRVLHISAKRFSVDRELLWKALTRSGVSVKMLTSIDLSHESIPACVCTDDREHSERLHVTQRLRQGCMLLPLLISV